MLFHTQDPLSRYIKLKKATWEYKILNYHHTNDSKVNGNSHPEMEELYEELIKCVEQPQYILEDTKIITNEEGIEFEIPNEKRQEYFRFFFDDEDKLGIIKTIVQFTDDENGDIVTAHKMNGRIKGVKKGGRIIYDSTKKS